MPLAVAVALLCCTLADPSVPFPPPVAATPAARTGHALAYDAAGRRVLLFGGYTAAGNGARLMSDLWAWDGTAWSRLDDGSAGPPPRDDAAVAWDDARGRLVVFGGRRRAATGLELLRDTWEWDGAHWRRADSGGPAARVHTTLAYDPAQRLIVLFGGSPLDGPAMADTWGWDGTRWRQLEGAGPAAPAANALLWDPRARRLLLHTAAPAAGDSGSGYFTGALWTRGGSGWRPAGAGPRFSPRAPVAAAPGGGLLLFAGFPPPPDSSAAFRWRDGAWERVAGGGPSRRRGTAMVYDAARNRTLLYGGEVDERLLDDMWEWDGVRWTRR